MSAVIIDGKAVAAKINEQIAHDFSEIKKKHGQSPRLISLIVGDDAATLSYIDGQKNASQRLGVNYEVKIFPKDVSLDVINTFIEEINQDDHVHGLMINKPLPAHLNFDQIVSWINPNKDIERFALCTPMAAMALLKSTGIELRGKKAVVIGRSQIVGRPLASMLLDEDCTVTICHSVTAKMGQLNDFLNQADIVLVAVGQPEFLKGDALKPGVVIIDVGINRVDGKLKGDVDFNSCLSKASFISPVPGGVGPVTSVMLMNNLLNAFRKQLCLIS